MLRSIFHQGHCMPGGPAVAIPEARGGIGPQELFSPPLFGRVIVRQEFVLPESGAWAIIPPPAKGIRLLLSSLWRDPLMPNSEPVVWDTPIIEVEQLTRLHRATVVRWHREGIDNPYQGVLELICQQHEQNYRLWHQEDIARRTDVSDAEIAQVKRAIDALNQKRNDLIEQIDDWLVRSLAAWGVEPQPEARLNTETPGSVIDRLSILSLRIYHMEEQASRDDADEAHRQRAMAKLTILHEQRSDLSLALVELLGDIRSGCKRLKVYRQFKMYNDPTLNPSLYAQSKKPAA